MKNDLIHESDRSALKHHTETHTHTHLCTASKRLLMEFMFTIKRRDVDDMMKINTTNTVTYLDSFLFEIDFECQLFAQHHIGIVSLFKGGFQLFELLLGENGSMASFSFRWRSMMRQVAGVMVTQGVTSLNLSCRQHIIRVEIWIGN